MIAFLILLSLPFHFTQTLLRNSGLTSNNDCQSADDAELGSFLVQTTSAMENSFSTCGTSSDYNLWYKYLSDFDGFLQISTCDAANFQTVVSVYTDCGSLTSTYSCNFGGCSSGLGTYTNFQVADGTTYYFLIGGIGEQRGSTTVTLSQATLSLTLLTSSVTSAGGAVQFIASTTASYNFRLNFEVICGGNTVFQEVNFYTSDDVQEFTMPAAGSDQVCQVNVSDINNNALSDTADLPVYGQLEVTSPSQGDSLYQDTPFKLRVANLEDPIALGLVNVTFACPNGEQLLQVIQNTDDFNAIVNSPLLGICEIYAISAEPDTYYETFSNITVTLLPAPIVTTTESETATTTDATTSDFITSSEATITEYSTSTDDTTTEHTTTDYISSTTYHVTSTEVTTTDVATSTDAITTMAVTYSLALSVYSGNPAAGFPLSYSLSFTPPLVASAQLKLTCNSVVVQTVDTSSTLDVQIRTFVVGNAAVGPCSLQAFSLDSAYPDSNIVDLTIYQQLTFSSDSLQGWVSGTMVLVDLSSPNQQSVTVKLIASCSIGSYSQEIQTSSQAQYNIPITLNGIGCPVSVIDLPSYYLAPASVSVNIAIAPSQVSEIVNSLSLLSFLNVVNAVLN